VHLYEKKAMNINISKRFDEILSFTSHCKYHGTLAALTQLILFVKMLEFSPQKI
jgi:hypothetical protein